MRLQATQGFSAVFTVPDALISVSILKMQCVHILQDNKANGPAEKGASHTGKHELARGTDIGGTIGNSLDFPGKVGM